MIPRFEQTNNVHGCPATPARLEGAAHRRWTAVWCCLVLLTGAWGTVLHAAGESDEAASSSTSQDVDATGDQQTAAPSGDAAVVTENAATSEATPGPADGSSPEPQDEEVKTEPPPFILDPYAVDVRISFAADPLLPTEIQQRVLANVDDLLNSQFRQMWRLNCDVAVGDRQWTAQELERMTDNDAAARYLDSELSKIFLVTVEQSVGHYQIHCREWDRSSQTLSSDHAKETYDRRLLAAKISQAISEAFRPLAVLEVLEGETIEFQIRAGEFPPRDSEVVQFRPGDFLIPFMRYLDRNRKVRRIQAIPWTYLRVADIDRSRMRLTMTSAFRSPIPAARRRVEVMALRIRPHLPATRVRIYPRGNPLNPLVGYRCEILDRLPTDEDPVDDRVKLWTDRTGIVTIPGDQEQPLKFLRVHSGAALLAQVPLIPGNAPQLEVEVPDDRARLNVEGEVALLQGELIDVIATREVLMARTRAVAKKKEWGKVDQFLRELDELPTLEEFLGRIETLQVQAVYAAQQARDRVAESRIKRLCSGIRASTEKHLDKFRITEFKRDINSLRTQ